ncbi:MAG: aspartyl protease family protein [Candidatus Tumulicola sp.]
MSILDAWRALLVPGLVLAATAAMPAHPDAQAGVVIRESAAAMGISALHGVRAVHIDAAVSFVGLSGTGSQWIDLAGPRFAEYVTVPPLVQDDGFDGSVTWNRDRSGLVWNDGSDAGRSAEIDAAYVARMALWRPDADDAAVQFLGTKANDGRAYDVLTVLPEESKLPMDLWFDRHTHVLRREVLANGPLVTTTTFSGYRRVGGALFPFAVQAAGSDGNTSVDKVTQVVLDPADASPQLRRPASSVHDFSIANGATSTIPFTLHENHVYLNVMLNGKGPYLFIFDTGGGNVIDPEVAQAIGAIGKGSAQGGGAGSGTETASLADVDTLQVGDAVLKHQLFAVAPVRMGFGVATGKNVDGLIGWEVLARFLTRFDYAENQVVLTLPDRATPQANAHAIPFVFYGTQPQIDCKIDGIPSECTIDTGARDTLTLFGPYLAAHPEVRPAKLSEIGVNGFGFGGPALGRLGRLREFEIGGMQLNDLVADYTTQTQGALAAPFIAANIGGNLLRRFDITFDYGKQTMALVPNPTFNDPDRYERVGLFLINKGGKITVVDARPGTPGADAGIAPGDVISTIDGAPTEMMSLEGVRATFYQPAGTVVRLGVTTKDGTQRTVAVTLRDFV